MFKVLMKRKSQQIRKLINKVYFISCFAKGLNLIVFLKKNYLNVLFNFAQYLETSKEQFSHKM